MEVKKLRIFGDSEIVVKQVKNQIRYISAHLLSYRNRVRELLRAFDEYSINFVPHNKNSAVDLLASVASKLIPSDDFPDTTFYVHLIFRPFVPINISNF